MQNEDEGEWSDGQSEIAAEAKRSPKSSKKRKLSSSSSSSIMAGFCSSNYQKKQTKKKANKGTFWSAQMRRETRQKRFSNTTTRN